MEVKWKEFHELKLREVSSCHVSSVEVEDKGVYAIR